MPVERNEIESVSSSSKTKNSQAFLSLIDSDSKLIKKSKSTDDVSYQSESAGSKSSATNRRGGRRRVAEASSSISSEPAKNVDNTERQSELNSKASNLADAIEKSKPNQSSDSRARRLRSSSRESFSSRDSSVDSPSNHRRRSHTPAELSSDTDESKQRRRSIRREGSKKRSTEKHDTSRETDEKSRRKRNNKHKDQKSKDFNFNDSTQDFFAEANHSLDDSLDFAEKFNAFPSEGAGGVKSHFETLGFQNGNGDDFTDDGFPPMVTNDFSASLNHFDTSGGATTFSEFNAFDSPFDQSMTFPRQSLLIEKDETVWDKSPHKEVPDLSKGELSIALYKIMSSTFLCEPIANPLNGNVILCCHVNGVACIQELDPNRSNVQVSCIPILSDEVRQKVAVKYNQSIHSISRVVALQSGMHFAIGRTRVRVGVIVELKLCESNQTLKLVLIWRWGYGVPLVGLQYVLTMPTGAGMNVDGRSFRIADEIVFMAASSPNGSFIFLCKPVASDTWMANSLETAALVTDICLVDRMPRGEYPYLVVAFSDNSLSVWTYKSALSKTAFKDANVNRVLLPLCRLDHSAIHSSLESTPLDETDISEDSGSKSFERCTQIVSMPPDNPLSKLLLVAAAFLNGVAVFHVALPVNRDGNKVRQMSEPLQNTTLASTPRITPLAGKRWRKTYSHSTLAWVSLGPAIGPCLTISLHGQNSIDSRLVVTSIEFPSFKRGLIPKRSLLPFHVFAKLALLVHMNRDRSGLLRSTLSKSSLFYTQRDLMMVTLSTSAPGELSEQLDNCDSPITSSAHGIKSSGDSIAIDSDGENGAVLYLFKTIQIERQKDESDNYMEWTLPVQRNWICRALSADNHSTKSDEKKDDQGFARDEEYCTDTRTELVCELYHDALSGLVPFRIVPLQGTHLISVLFRSPLGSKANMSKHDRKIALLNPKEKVPVVDVLDGRDILFLQGNDQKPHCGFLLSPSGSSLSYFDWDGEARCTISSACRPIVGVECNKEYIGCNRTLIFPDESKFTMAAVGKRIRDDRLCFVTGDMSDLSAVSPESWSAVLPSIVKGPALWFEENEEFFSAITLEPDGNGHRNFAVATSTRVLLVSSDLKVLAAKRTKKQYGHLSPIGAFVVAFVDEEKLHYLCYLEGLFRSGVIASLTEAKLGLSKSSLVSIRPDRLVLLNQQAIVRLVECGENPDTFLLLSPLVKPSLLLEPLIANAICVAGKESKTLDLIRTIIERFGRSASLITHGEGEGIGQKGAGLTSKVFDMLAHYGLNHAASWLLTGTVQFDISANTVVLPPWLPVSLKSAGAFDADGILHVISSGDSYLSDCVKSSNKNISATLPRVSDPTSYLAAEYAEAALARGQYYDALKMLDMDGSESANSRMLQLAMALECDKAKDASRILKLLTGFEGNLQSLSSTPLKSPAALAALLVTKKDKIEPQGVADQSFYWVQPLAPSLQRGPAGKRFRQRLISDTALQEACSRKSNSTDRLWTSPCNESRHVWNEGPRKDRSRLLLLDRIEDWLERRRPLIIGKEYANGSQERGEQTLADILNKDDDSFGDKGDIDSVKDMWVDGVGEGRSDEANISGYFRFSEGEDKDYPWKIDGFADLSPYQNKSIILGDPESISLQPSTSNVDEGESGKVKSLYDVVFERSGIGLLSGLAFPAPRGGSLDIGVLHSVERDSRKKCTIEFWFYLPSSESGAADLILMRRTIGNSADDFSKACPELEKDGVLWELAVRKNGELVFKTCGGSMLVSTEKYKPIGKSGASENNNGRPDLVTFERWNHVCLVLNSKGMETSKCEAKMYIKGVEVASSNVSVLPVGFEEGDLDGSLLDDALQKSHILFGLNHTAGFRVTELRFWACARSSEDVQSFLYEYLTAAEQKKKFKVKITSKNKKGAAIGKIGFAPPRGALSSITSEGVVPPRGMIPVKSGGLLNIISKGASPEKSTTLHPTAPTTASSSSRVEASDNSRYVARPQKTPVETEQTVNENVGAPPVGRDTVPKVPMRRALSDHSMSEGADTKASVEDDDEMDSPITLWDTALPLSQQIRPSAAAALIRGPPATRHYGGNRGGLPDFSGVDRFGVGGIAICGSEKTIVFRDNEDPPALTYPIGASGAVVSDQMDEVGSEFLCCFLANEKRMVVFELRSRTVVVELQMTTKLNFWRYLPPEAGENTLCFMLVTPVGGFHWMPLEESPRPHQVWKRGIDLQGKKIVGYEEGGSNGLDDNEIRSRVGLVLATKASGGGFLEAWVIPISGDSVALSVSENIMGACLCQPLFIDDGPFLPLVVAVHDFENYVVVNLVSILEPDEGSLEIGNIETRHDIDISEYEREFEPPSLAMGTYPEALCVSLSNIIVVILRRRGVIAAFEVEEEQLNLISQECVDHYVIDAVMRYSAEVGGAEIVMLLADNDNPKDGRIVSFCFRSAA